MTFSFKYVKPPVCERETGYTVKAQQRKIEDKVWLEGYEYIKAPDGNILISIEGVNRWAEGRRAAA